MDILRAMAVLIEYPVLALVPALVFAVLYVKSKSRLILTVAIFWPAYFFYESGMYLRILCSGECNIRVDLLLLYPMLIFASLGGLVLFAVLVFRRNK